MPDESTASRHIGVEPFGVDYGSGYNIDRTDPPKEPCRVVEDQGEFSVHEVSATGDVPERVAFVDGVRRADARLSLTESDGSIVSGLAGAHGVGAVLVDGGRAVVDRIATRRLVIFGSGARASIPSVGGWSWDPASVSDTGPDAPLQRLQTKMRDAERVLAEALIEQGWLTVVDGPLSYTGRTLGRPVVGYVKTHYVQLLAPEFWARVPQLSVGERTSLFVQTDGRYSCYVRVGQTPTWASSWAGIARLDVPSGAALEDVAAVVDSAAAWLPGFASELHRDPRAPVNLTPVAALEKRLRRELGSPALAMRAVRTSVAKMVEGLAS